MRISGPQAFELVPEVERPRRSLAVQTSRLHFAPENTGVLACVTIAFVAPASYTGEDGIELLLPGNPVLLERVIDLLLVRGARQDIDVRRAGPGEFTARAFMNGRISLAAAEGVAATIAARSDGHLDAARHLGSGRLAEHARALADEITGALALVEAGIDFTDQEDVVPISPATLLRTLSGLKEKLTSVLDRAVGMETIEAIPWVVLTGAPNAGKSTLFNTLLGRSRAVVSGIAGTTRDVIAEPLTLPDGGEVMLVDVAGAERPGGSLETAMQTRALEAIDRAELRLECVPIDDAFEDAGGHPGAVVVRTMADRGGNGPGDVLVSAHLGTGLPELMTLIGRRIGERAVSLAADAVVVLPRHESALGHAAEAITAAITLLTPHRDDHDLPEPELIAAALRSALDALATVAGEVTPDDVLGRVFATFCVGK